MYSSQAPSREKGGMVGKDRDAKQVTATVIAWNHRSREQLKLSEENYRTIFENSAVAITVSNKDEQIVSWNRLAEALLGMNSDALYLRPVSSLYPEEEWVKIRAQHVRRKGIQHHFETRIIRKDKQTVDIDLSLSVLKGPDGNVIGSIGIMADITERKRAEEALQASENRYRSYIEVTGGIGWTTNADGEVTEDIPSFRKFTGQSYEEVKGWGWSNALHPDDYENVIRVWKKAVEEKSGYETEYRIRRYDGIYRYFLARGMPTLREDSSIREWVGTCIDITERKRAEENQRRLQQELSVSSRLASVGKLASGVAHEINNPLTSVIGFSQIMMAKDIPEDAKEDLKIIDENAQRVARIVSNLLFFARQRKPGREHVDLNSLISQVIELRAYKMKSHNIEVTTEFAPDLPLTMADGGQLQQVFFNIILNAEQAMSAAHNNKGNLLIKTERIDNIIRMSFRDDGPGIASGNLDKIFDPFFTTKPVGEGDGLGLSLSYGIIKEHGGKIYADSTWGQGATFVVELPIVSEPERAELAGTPLEEAKSVVGKRIMVVDNEPAIR